MRDELERALQARGVPEEIVGRVRDSGYFLKQWGGTSGATYVTVSDPLYGNKAHSSSFELDGFVRYLQGEPAFEPLPPLNRIRVRNRREIDAYLNDERLQRYQADESLTLRGQPREHRIHRAVPNPVRANSDGEEVSILPGLYRQPSDGRYSLAKPVEETRAIEPFRDEIESGAGDALSTEFTADFMRVEQHYARQTSGLDVTFDIESAIFFATHRFMRGAEGLARYEAVARGDHVGIIYLFRFGSPSVRRTEYLIQDFDYFRINWPLRVIRQVCGLPHFDSYERNIAVTDVDTVIELDPDFDGASAMTPQHMFPNAGEDRFYGKLLALKDRYPEALRDVVEYEWARTSAASTALHRNRSIIDRQIGSFEG